MTPANPSFFSVQPRIGLWVGYPLVGERGLPGLGMNPRTDWPCPVPLRVSWVFAPRPKPGAVPDLKLAVAVAASEGDEDQGRDGYEGEPPGQTRLAEERHWKYPTRSRERVIIRSG